MTPLALSLAPYASWALSSLSLSRRSPSHSHTRYKQGKKFWSTKDPGQQPFTYQAGVGGVIKGWDQGCLGMQIGETRKLVIPAHEGYGANGFPAWGIPPGGTLDFTLECLSIQ